MKHTTAIASLLVFISNVSFSAPLQDLIQRHYQRYSAMEHFTAIQVSIKAGDKKENYVIGNRSTDPVSGKISTNDLFDIGSITKSFTGALAVLAESEGKLKLDDDLSKYLPEYPHWGSIPLTNLMNMSTGIPNYSDSATMNYTATKDLKKIWKPTELISIVYNQKLKPPRKPGYFYSNTGYVLMDLILTKAYQQSYSSLLHQKILQPLNLSHTTYPIPKYSSKTLNHLVRGYSYNIYDNPELLGKDVTENNLSWAGAAGALVSNSADVLRWIEALFIDSTLLTTLQKETMQKLVSTTTGKPIATVNEKDPRGFGLGLVEIYDKKIGKFWFYEGQTLGYRAVYIYVPCNKVIVTALFNSATNGENDHSHALLVSLYDQILLNNEHLRCSKKG